MLLQAPEHLGPPEYMKRQQKILSWTAWRELSSTAIILDL